MNCIKQIKTTGHFSENRMKLSKSVSKAVRKNLNDGKILREKSSSALKTLDQVSYFGTRNLWIYCVDKQNCNLYLQIQSKATCCVFTLINGINVN